MRKTSKRRVGVADIDDAVDRLVESLNSSQMAVPRGWVDSYELGRRTGLAPAAIYLKLHKAGVPSRRYTVHSRSRTFFDAAEALARITKKTKKV